MLGFEGRNKTPEEGITEKGPFPFPFSDTSAGQLQAKDGKAAVLAPNFSIKKVFFLEKIGVAPAVIADADDEEGLET